MKFNWVNILATLLIIGGVGTLIANRWQGHQPPNTLTAEGAKAAIQRKMEAVLGRPMSEAETDMFEVSKNKDNSQFILVVHQPLRGRLEEAGRLARAATQASSHAAPAGFQPGNNFTPGSSGNAFETNAGGPATIPSSGMP